MTERHPKHVSDMRPDDEISLLDILVVIAENFWLLLLVPLAIAAITYGVFTFLPPTYKSTAILYSQSVDGQNQTDKDTTAESAVLVARLNTPEVQGPATDSQTWITQQNLDPQAMDLLLQNAINVRSDQKTGLVTISTFAPTPKDARELAQSLIDSYIEATLPKGAARAQIEQRIAIARSALSVMDRAIAAILNNDPKTGEARNDLTGQPNSQLPLADLLAQKSALETTIIELESRLTDPMAIVIQSPTFEPSPARTKRLQITAFATILSGLALTVFVFSRAALRAVAHDPESADKITRIRRGLLRR